MDESSRDDQLGEGAIVRAGTIDVQRAHSLNDETMKHNHERISCILASQDVVGSAWTGERRSDSGSSASSSRSSRMLTKHSSFPARKNASDREMDITPPTLRAIDSGTYIMPLHVKYD